MFRGRRQISDPDHRCLYRSPARLCPGQARALREAIRAEAPHAEEKIGYGIPTFVLGENLVHFASFTHHIGFYPGPSGIAAFKEELAGYKGAKGSVQFPLEGPLPLDLVARITRFRVQEAVARTEAKRRRA